MSIMPEESYVLLLHFLLLTSTSIPYVVIIFSHYTFCVTFNMLLYKKKEIRFMSLHQSSDCIVL